MLDWREVDRVEPRCDEFSAEGTPSGCPIAGRPGKPCCDVALNSFPWCGWWSVAGWAEEGKPRGKPSGTPGCLSIEEPAEDVGKFALVPMLMAAAALASAAEAWDVRGMEELDMGASRRGPISRALTASSWSRRACRPLIRDSNSMFSERS